MNTLDLVNSVLASFDVPILHTDEPQPIIEKTSETKELPPIVYIVEVDKNAIIPKNDEVEKRSVKDNIVIEEIDNSVVVDKKQKTKKSAKPVSKTKKQKKSGKNK